MDLTQILASVLGGGTQLQNVIQSLNSGGNPMGLVQQVLGGRNSQDPKMVQAARLIQGKNAGELEKTARNLANEIGMTPEQILQQLGIHIPNG